MPTPGTEKSKKPSNSTQNAKFDEIQRKNVESLKKRVQSYEDSDSDEENVEIDKNKISDLFKNYQGNDVDIARIAHFFESGDSVDCLICIRQVKSKDKIWTCSNCFTWIHLQCIQKWANDSMCQKRIFYQNQPTGYYSNTGVFMPKEEVKVVWDCPQCRKEYEPSEIPRYYECFCGRERDPLPQSFLLPHSCGEMCNRLLDPSCGHRCLIYCHPGPHPICAQIIKKSCQCGKSPMKAIRCAAKQWNCAAVCLRTLSCGVHKCESICHDDCPPCAKSRSLRCNCGSQTKDVKCVQESWSCQKVCKKKFPCGKHFCEQKCHAGDCGTCPFGLSQSCFCGKQVVEVENCEDFTVQSCGDTCLKPLACGNDNHRCLQRCHPLDRGCGTCTELLMKKCRCGNLTKEYQCSKELLCENKCKLQKNCKKHACNKKCCVGCLPCDKICGKALSCGKHKCAALCHDGSCYPCVEKQKIKCRCGSTTKIVLCGCAKKAKPPKCKEQCKFQSKCHHEGLPHKCHFGDCASCVQACGEMLPCNHLCLGKCHDYVKVVTKDKHFVPKMPGEEPAEKVEMKKLPHPACQTKIPVVCIGGHETSMISCHEAKVLSCGRLCGRKLNCGNHICNMLCHSVKNIDSLQQDENCEDCESPCTIKRPSGCTHPCPRESCHQGSCKRCHVQVKAKCFCGLTDVYYRCCDVHKRDLDEHEVDFLRQKFLSCGSRCIKMYPCGHQCASNCHPGLCPRSEDCKKKIKLVCTCKTRKLDVTCDIVRAENLTEIECDDICIQKKKLADEQKLLENAKKAEVEAEKNRLELEQFEKKFGKKKYRGRKTKVNEDTKDNWTLFIVSGVIVLSALVLYFTMF